MQTKTIDRTITTNAVPQKSKERSDTDSDRQTINNAVSSANISALAGKPIEWANQTTSAYGTITQVTEFKSQGEVCRRFLVKKENYYGVALFNGETCLNEDEQWDLKQFQAL